MKMGEIASCTEYQMDERFHNCQFFEPNFDFPNRRISKFFNFRIWTIPKTSNLESSKNFGFWKFQKFAIWQILKKIQFRNFQKFLIWKISKMSNL